MNRRSFLSMLGVGAAATAFDPERLLWVPGVKTIFVPAPPRILKPIGVWNGHLITADDIVDGSEGSIEQFGGSLMSTVQLKPDVRMFGADDSILAGGHGRIWIQVSDSAMVEAAYNTTGRFDENFETKQLI